MPLTHPQNVRIRRNLVASRTLQSPCCHARLQGAETHEHCRAPAAWRNALFLMEANVQFLSHSNHSSFGGKCHADGQF